MHQKGFVYDACMYVVVMNDIHLLHNLGHIYRVVELDALRYQSNCIEYCIQTLPRIMFNYMD